jgi:hypothetical protein
MRAPSGDQLEPITRAPSGSFSGTAAPLALSTTRKPLANDSTRRERSTGSMRIPASPSHGATTSAIVGMAGRSDINMRRASGEKSTLGGGGASSTSTIACGGKRYPES